MARQLPSAAFGWLRDNLATASRGSGTAQIYKTLGLISRRLGKLDIALTESDLRQARMARDGWDPKGWTVDEAGRVLVVCRLAEASGEDFPRIFTVLCRTAEVGEAIALYRGLPLYPVPDRLMDQAAEGLRTNMRAVFEAVAHRNPFPRERFDEQRWNQMVLKALFIGSPLHPIQGLEDRNDPRLATMLLDFAHERWAAGRSVPLELWRCVGPFADERGIADLRRVLETGDLRERQAAALALSTSAHPNARAALESCPDVLGQITGGVVTWESLASETASRSP